MRPALGFALALLLIAAGLGAEAGAGRQVAIGEDPVRAAGAAEGPAGQLAAPDGPNGSVTGTAIDVTIQSDGDAVWRVETELSLGGSNETRAFRRLSEDYANGELDDDAVDLFRRLARSGSEATGRPMSIRNVSRSWRIAGPENGTPTDTGNRSGVLALRFVWTGFAEVDGDRVVLGDVFEVEGGWLPGLTDRQTLVIRSPPEYSVQSANVGPKNGTLRWTGPTRFGPEELDATFVPGSGLRPPLPALDARAIGAVVGGVALVLAGYWLVRRRRSGGGAPPADPRAAPEPNGGSADDPDDGATEGAADGADEDDRDESDPFAGVDETLLSDAERVERHLEAEGGRMKQSQIVEATGWSNAKVSQLLSSMADEGRVEKLRIGRENLISLPDESEESNDD